MWLNVFLSINVKTIGIDETVVSKVCDWNLNLNVCATCEAPGHTMNISSFDKNSLRVCQVL